jgi:hypothetical protein
LDCGGWVHNGRSSPSKLISDDNRLPVARRRLSCDVYCRCLVAAPTVFRLGHEWESMFEETGGAAIDLADIAKELTVGL